MVTNQFMSKIDLKTLVLQVEDIARQAGGEIMKHYKGTGVYIKADGSEVTDADHASEDMILPALKALTPDIPIVSEERVTAGEIPDTSGGAFWTVDPLDGTTEFVNKTGAFVVAIALVIDNCVVLGVMYHPATGMMYSGCGPGTATKTGPDGVRLPLSVKKSAENDELRVLVNEPHADVRRIQGYLTAQFGKAAKIDTKSSVFRPCQVAEGSADLAVFCSAKRQGHIYWWDVAPGHAIVEAAGGIYVTMEGHLPLVYDAPNLQVPPHAALPALPSKNITPPRSGHPNGGP